MQTLYIVSCSQRKRREPGRPIPAIERYDGVFFRALRKAIRLGKMASTDRVLIISARFGLIEPQTPIPWYDQRLDGPRAKALATTVKAELIKRLSSDHNDRVCINVGRRYASLLEGIPQLANARWATGGIGTRARILKSWLTD